MHRVIVSAVAGIEMPCHPGDSDGRLLNSCTGVAFALRADGAIDQLLAAEEGEGAARARYLPLGQLDKIAALRTVWLAARWLRAGKTPRQIAPLLASGPGPETALALLEAGTSVDRLARWAGYELNGCTRWARYPKVTAVAAEALDRAGLHPAEVDEWVSRGVPAHHLRGWWVLQEAGLIAVDDIAGWARAGVKPRHYEDLNPLKRRDRLIPLQRYEQWAATGVARDQIRTFDEAGLDPAQIGKYGTALAGSDAHDIVDALGYSPDSEAAIPVKVLAKFLKAGHPPYTAVFLKGEKFPLPRPRGPGRYAVFENKLPPDISWAAARQAIKSGASIDALFAVPGWEPNDGIWIMGGQHNETRIKNLRRTGRDGTDRNGRPWYVGILYPAPDDPRYGFDELVGIVTRAGHIGCLMPGMSYLRPFVDALTEHGKHFVVPLMRAGDEMVIALPRGRQLMNLIDQYHPDGVRWSWPTWGEGRRRIVPD
jgi:hypothetical protein